MGTHIVIDRGNTRTKIGVYSGNRLVKVLTGSRFSTANLRDLISRFEPEAVLLSAVAKIPVSWRKLFSTRTHLVVLDNNTPIPIKNRYSTPATLGTDRIAAAVAGQHMYPEKNVLVVDVGTCIKYDFIDAGGNYRGGSISPGIRMRLNAMHHFTDRLPLLEPKRIGGFLGKDTYGSMMTGAVVGAALEIEGFAVKYRKKYRSLKVVITGGDALLLSDHLKIGIFAAPELVLDGLHQILLHAIKKS
ncbi:MAG: type III pantothenate kinase [Bacteroidota bacterium]